MSKPVYRADLAGIPVTLTLVGLIATAVLTSTCSCFVRECCDGLMTHFMAVSWLCVCVCTCVQAVSLVGLSDARLRLLPRVGMPHPLYPRFPSHAPPPTRTRRENGQSNCCFVLWTDLHRWLLIGSSSPLIFLQNTCTRRPTTFGDRSFAVTGPHSIHVWNSLPADHQLYTDHLGNIWKHVYLGPRSRSALWLLIIMRYTNTLIYLLTKAKSINVSSMQA